MLYEVVVICLSSDITINECVNIIKCVYSFDSRCIWVDFPFWAITNDVAISQLLSNEIWMYKYEIWIYIHREREGEN